MKVMYGYVAGEGCCARVDKNDCQSRDLVVNGLSDDHPTLNCEGMVRLPVLTSWTLPV